MKFIIDAHLPKSIALCFKECDIIHTSDLDKGNRTTDKTINEISVLEERIFIT